MFFLRDHFSLKNAGEKEEYTALYIRAPRIDGRFSTLHKVEEEIDARFNSGSKMEFLSGRFEIKIRMFLKIIFPGKWKGGRKKGDTWQGKSGQRVSDLLRDVLFQTLQVSPVSLHLDTRNSIDTIPRFPSSGSRYHWPRKFLFPRWETPLETELFNVQCYLEVENRGDRLGRDIVCMYIYIFILFLLLPFFFF